MHELWTVLEVSRGVVGLPDRDSDVGGLLHGHSPALGDTLRGPGLATATAPRKYVLPGLLGHSTDSAGIVDLLADRVLDGSRGCLTGLRGHPAHRAPVRSPSAVDELPRSLDRQRHQGGEPGARGEPPRA